MPIASECFLLARPRPLGFSEVSGAAQFVAAQPLGTSPSWALWPRWSVVATEAEQQ